MAGRGGRGGSERSVQRGAPLNAQRRTLGMSVRPVLAFRSGGHAMRGEGAKGKEEEEEGHSFVANCSGTINHPRGTEFSV